MGCGNSSGKIKVPRDTVAQKHFFEMFVYKQLKEHGNLSISEEEIKELTPFMNSRDIEVYGRTVDTEDGTKEKRLYLRTLYRGEEKNESDD